MTDKEFEKEWKARAKAKAPKAKAKVKPKAKKGKVSTLASLSDFLQGVKGTTLTSGRTEAGRKSQALKALYRALANRGWTSKGMSMVKGKHEVRPNTGIDFGVVVDNKYALSLGKGAILEVDAYMGSIKGN